MCKVTYAVYVLIIIAVIIVSAAVVMQYDNLRGDY